MDNNLDNNQGGRRPDKGIREEIRIRTAIRKSSVHSGFF